VVKCKRSEAVIPEMSSEVVWGGVDLAREKKRKMMSVTLENL
jgi:hypothetical protein